MRRSSAAVAAVLGILIPSLSVGAAPSAVRRVGAPTAAEAVCHGRAPCASPARYVAPMGSDANTGTLKQPWKTLGKAIRVLGPGQTAYLRAGVYSEATGGACGSSYNVLTWSRSGTASAPITISGYPGEKAQVLVQTKLKLTGSYLRLTDLVLDRNRAYSSFDNACTGEPNVNVYGDDVELNGLEIRNSNMSGIYLSAADRVAILRNWIHDNGTHPELDHGIYVSSSTSMVIANNLIERNLAYGIHIYPDATDGARVFQNTVVAQGRSGLVLSGASSRNLIANNIFALNQEYGIREDELNGTDNEAIRNLFYGNRRGAFWLPDGRMTESQSIFGDPLFVHAAARNYRLRAGSPALHRALPAFSRAFDYEGRRRPRGRGPDVGAFER